MTELHSEGWKGWAYEYQNSWAICDVNRILQSDWSHTIHVADTKLGNGMQPNYPRTRYVRPAKTSLALDGVCQSGENTR